MNTKRRLNTWNIAMLGLAIAFIAFMVLALPTALDNNWEQQYNHTDHTGEKE